MIETKKLLMDFVEKYRKTIGYACLAWFVFTIIVSYLVFTHPLKSIDVFVRDLYFKVKLNSLMPNFLFSPKALLFNLESVKAIEKGFDNAKLIFYAYLFLPFAISFFSFFGGTFLFLKYQINMFRKKTETIGQSLSGFDFEKKYPKFFGNKIELCGVNFSEKILECPIHIYGNEAETNDAISNFLNQSREKKTKAVVFGCKKYSKLSESDDFFIGAKDGWNFMDDLRKSKEILTAELLENVNFRSKGAQMYHLIQELVKKNIDAENFLDLLCFKSIDSAIPRLQQHLNVKDDVDSFKKIRNEIAEKLYWLKNIDTENGTRSVSEFYENDSAAVLWIQKDTSPLLHILEKIIKPETIKIFCVDIPGANANPNTIVINGKYSNDRNKIVLPTAIENSREHLGTAKTTHPKFFGTYYQNIFRPLLDKNESIKTLLFKPAKCLDLMRI